MEKFEYYIVRSLMLLCFSLLLVSCEDETLTDVPDQLFRPVIFKTAINGNIATLSWIPIANASYSLELSRDSLLFGNELQVIPLDDLDTYAVGDLWSNSRYSARIKAVSKNSLIKDSEYNELTFITGTENIFYGVLSEDIGTNSVLLKWDNSKEVTKIVIAPSVTPGYELAIVLSSADIAAGQKLIDGLSSGITYVFKIYKGEMLRGTISVKTK